MSLTTFSATWPGQQLNQQRKLSVMESTLNSESEHLSGSLISPSDCFCDPGKEVIQLFLPCISSLTTALPTSGNEPSSIGVPMITKGVEWGIPTTCFKSALLDELLQDAVSHCPPCGGPVWPTTPPLRLHQHTSMTVVPIFYCNYCSYVCLCYSVVNAFQVINILVIFSLLMPSTQ